MVIYGEAFPVPRQLQLLFYLSGMARCETAPRQRQMAVNAATRKVTRLFAFLLSVYLTIYLFVIS